MRVEPGLRNALNEQATLIQDALDVATIQDDVIRAVKEDPRMADFKRAEFLKELDGKILPLTTVGLLGAPWANYSYSTSMRIPWVISRFVWRFSRLRILDKHQK